MQKVEIERLKKEQLRLAHAVGVLRTALVECEHQTHSMRVWGGQEWSYHPPQAKKIAKVARDALEVPNVELTDREPRR